MFAKSTSSLQQKNNGKDSDDSIIYYLRFQMRMMYNFKLFAYDVIKVIRKTGISICIICRKY